MVNKQSQLTRPLRGQSLLLMVKMENYKPTNKEVLNELLNSGKQKLLAETGVFLPEIGSESLPFPAIFFKMMYTPEMCEGNKIKKLVSLETSFLDVFENKGYEFHSEIGMGCITTHHGMTKVSTVGELDELFSDIRKVYDNIGGKYDGRHFKDERR